MCLRRFELFVCAVVNVWTMDSPFLFEKISASWTALEVLMTGAEGTMIPADPLC